MPAMADGEMDRVWLLTFLFEQHPRSTMPIRLGNFLLSMQCTGNSGCFPPGKASSHSTVLPSCIFHLTGCEAYCFFLNTTGGYGISNVHATLGACRTYTRMGSGNQTFIIFIIKICVTLNEVQDQYN